ncbi:MAG: hypothetical protein ACTSSE_13780 [Candidatus Thorarchaeota archaeon]
MPSQFGGCIGRDFTDLMRMEFLWIPITLYLLAIVFSAIAYVYVRRNE